MIVKVKVFFSQGYEILHNWNLFLPKLLENKIFVIIIGALVTTPRNNLYIKVCQLFYRL